jgi:hypothetical protein
MNVENCSIISLPRLSDPRGDLTFIEADQHLPFSIKRVYYLYNVPKTQERGGHAHKDLHQLMIAISGSFDVLLGDGLKKKKFKLSQPDQGLYICPLIWRDLQNFSSGAVCMVLASSNYIESDYFRNFNEFSNFKLRL